MANYFTLFDLPSELPVDVRVLKQRYQLLQKQYHPDQFAHLSEQERHCAVKKSADINHAYQVLKHPLHSVEYFLSLQGIEVKTEQTLHDLTFLEKQLALREELEEISAIKSVSLAQEKLSLFASKMRTMQQAHQSCLMALLHEQNWLQAANLVRQLYFFDKLQQEIRQLEDHDF